MQANLSAIATSMGVTVRTVRNWSKQPSWPTPISGPKPIGGGEATWLIAELPERIAVGKKTLNVRQSVISNAAQRVIPICQAESHHLSQRQRLAAEARAAILLYVHRLSATFGTERAICSVVDESKGNALPADLAPLVSIANNKAGKNGRALTRATLYRWLAKFDLAQPNAVDLLAPRDAGASKRAAWLRESVAPWAEAALNLYRRPQKPSLRWVHEQLYKVLPAGVAVPSYDSLRRYINSLGAVELQRGRMGPRELKTLKPFVRRDKGALWPADIYMADGHAFDAEIAHPAHGRPFRPEITSVIDTSTRRLVGWSIDLAESGLAVLDALRCAVQNGGIPSVFYVDRGAGYRNAMISASGTGLLSRLGTELSHSLPYNSQARGVIERLHKALWVRAAKELPTYMGKDMDGEARNKIYKLTRADIERVGRSRLLMQWPDFLAYAAEKVDEYNNRPHSGLLMIVDQETGKRRHQTPNEAWAQGVAEGAQLVELMPGEMDHLFRPQRECKVLRGEVRLFNNVYFSHDLAEHHGSGVRVGYDIHDACEVFVYDADGSFICKAQLNGNMIGFMPENVLQQAARKRAEGRERRLQQHLNEVREELHGGPLVLENNPTQRATFFAPQPITVAINVDTQITELRECAESVPPSRPQFALPSERYEWLKGAGRDQWTNSDREFLSGYIHDQDGYALFAQRFELLGIAWSDTDANDLLCPVRVMAGGK